MKNRTHTPAETPEELLSDLRALVVEAEKITQNSVSEHSQEAIDSMRSRLESAQERLADLYQRTKQKITAGARYTDEAIRTHPYQSLTIALGVGLLAGILIGRRSK
jgi:ElaB/YqjD/DUF883 family membrane-anchored ribosome-binding protein